MPNASARMAWASASISIVVCAGGITVAGLVLTARLATFWHPILPQSRHSWKSNRFPGEAHMSFRAGQSWYDRIPCGTPNSDDYLAERLWPCL
jgi:hypothetical protein